MRKRSTARERRLRIFETNYGRDAGWYVEHRGRTVAQLVDPRYEDMFWVSYRIELLAENPQDAELAMSAPRWLACEFAFRNREFGDIVEHAFPGGGPFSEDGRISMRGLYLVIPDPSLWERLLLRWRKSRLAARNA